MRTNLIDWIGDTYDTIEIELKNNVYLGGEDENGNPYENVEYYTVVKLNGIEINEYTKYEAFLRERIKQYKTTSNYLVPMSYPPEELTKRDKDGYEIPLTSEWQYNVSSFYPFTCNCGSAGCAGIWNGILSKHRKHTVEWRASDEDGYNGKLPKRFYRFHKGQYDQQVDWLIIKLKEILDTNPEMLEYPEYTRELLEDLNERR